MPAPRVLVDVTAFCKTCSRACRRDRPGRLSFRFVQPDGQEPPARRVVLQVGYLQRTEWNVRDSDATVVFTFDGSLEGGSRRTAQFADKYCKPWLHFRPSVHPKFLAQFLVRHNVTTLNVAGKREDSAAGIYRFVFDTLERAIVFPRSSIEGKQTWL